ncbi:MAG: succinate dehydrogenase cytochrome b subunit [Bacteroidetes bacterium]|nr:succinate dehydrogenase cytochrome b subunit [Bacteroidota bacterium]
MSGIPSSSIARKIVMALSGLFLVFFLGQHFVINITSVIAPDTFNTWSHFMGYNPLVQYALQPVLIAGVIVHFVMGFVLEIQNRKARGVRYFKYNGGANASWISRNMIISGATILAFLFVHMYDFWFHEMVYKYVEFSPEDPTRYYAETVKKFHSPIKTGLYVISFVLLALHLLHGFASSFQTMGVNNKYSTAIKTFTKVYAIAIPLGFAFIAIYHHLNPITQ